MKDSFWSSLFKGKRLFVIDSNISDPIVFYPYKKGNAALIKIKNTNYLIDINPMTKIGVTKIKNINTNKEIIIK